MTTFLNVHWVYLVHVLHCIDVCAVWLAVIFGIGFVVAMTSYSEPEVCPGDREEPKRKLKLLMILFGVLCVISIITAVLIPSKDTLVQMSILREIEQSSYHYTLQDIREIIWYISCLI